MASAKDVNMEMRDGFAPVGTVVDNDAESLVKLLRASNFLRNQKKMTDRFGISFFSIGDPWDQFFGDNQGMNGSLGVDVPDCDA